MTGVDVNLSHVKRLSLVLWMLLVVLEGAARDHPETGKGTYLIITTEVLAATQALNDFVAFRSLDFTVEVVISSNIGTTADEFRTFIRNKMPSYVLLVGKYGDFPARVFQYGDKIIETYNYFAASSLTGFPAPDIPLGLFFVDNEAELNNIVVKTIQTENTFSSAPRRWYAHAGSNEPLWPWPVEFNEELLTEMNDRFFAPNGYEFSLATANDATPNDVQTDIQVINDGVKYFIYHGHGLMYKWTFGLGIGGLAQLHNTTYPLVFSFSCLTGSFSGVIDTNSAPCFAVKMLASPYGAAAFIGAYNVSGRGQNPMLEGLCSGLFHDSTDRLGDALIKGFNNTAVPNTVSKYYPLVTEEERIRCAWQFHLFGDPALKISEHASSADGACPSGQVVLHPNPTTGLVNISLPAGVPDALVSVSSSAGEQILGWSPARRVDLSDRPDGLYILKMKSHGVTREYKIVKTSAHAR